MDKNKVLLKSESYGSYCFFINSLLSVLCLLKSRNNQQEY